MRASSLPRQCSRCTSKLLRDSRYLDGLAEQIAIGLKRYREVGQAVAVQAAP